MKYYHGIAVAPGVAIGRISVVAGNQFNVRRRLISAAQVEDELHRLGDAYKRAEEELCKCRDDAAAQLGEQYAQIFEAHLMFLKDAGLRAMIENSVRAQYFSVEYAVANAFESYAKRLRALQDPHYAERANDIIDVRNRLLSELMAVAKEAPQEPLLNAVVAASFLAPSEAAKLDPERVIAIATENGGRGSHTSIVAAALGIPTVVGLGPFLADADDGSLAIVDGDKGQLILDPIPEVVERYRQRILRLEAAAKRRESMREKLVATTTDGVDIKIEGNIEFPSEAKTCYELGAAGIGLYRTEFLYLTEQTKDLPDEDAHFQAYKEVLSEMKGRLTIIRTFDLGADKTPEGRQFSDEKEPNPFMGLRSVRLSLRYTNMFRQQLRAILRASAFGKVAVMFPLVTTIREWRQAKMIFHDVREEFVEKGVPFDPDIPLGIMVETPATVIMLDQFARECDFFSVGTNDLLQYAQAVDRSNKEVNSLYAQESPALMRLIRHVVEVSDLYNRPVAVCGQMASEPANVPLLLGLGLRALSVAPKRILETKEICESFSIQECQRIAREAMLLETADDVRVYLRNEMRKALGNDAFDAD